jgi:2-keto-4-pentenoate hydratase
MTRPQTTAAGEAAAILWEAWTEGVRIDSLPERCRPRNRAEGYAIQSELIRISGQQIAGWKIAAMSLAGQRHINVDGPLAGPLLANRLVAAGSSIDLRGNRMRLAEAELPSASRHRWHRAVRCTRLTKSGPPRRRCILRSSFLTRATKT